MSDIETATSLAQTLLLAEPDRALITPTLIAEKVKIAASLIQKKDAVLLDQDAITSELIRRFSRWIQKATTLHSPEGHVDWLSSTRKSGWRYWKRYQNYLERRLPDRVVASLDDSTDDILGALEDPRREGVWDRRGLVVGHVQSGKTGNYSGLICKAADAGYKIIIVLAGMHNNLRSQTQIRLEEAFLGYRTSDDGRAGTPLGVFEFDSDQKINPNCGTTRADNGDFNRAKANTFAAISPEQLPWLFVVKKNKSVLTQLLAWLQSDRVADASDPLDGRRIVTHLPLLVVDDEADNGSVNTGEVPLNDDGTVDEEHVPKVINSLIRQILHTFSKSAYVGYTATPFANIYIHSKATTKLEGKDLFPEAFIVNLSAPSNYVGPARIFGRETKEGRSGGLPLSRDISDHFDPETKAGWMPPKHKKDHTPVYEGQDVLPPSLKEAIYSFAIACAVRVCRGQGAQHSSMLVHVTRLVDVQRHVTRQVEELILSMRLKIRTGIDREPILEKMFDLWETDFLSTSADIAMISPDLFEDARVPTWQDVVAALPQVLDDMIVMPVNGTAKEALDYSDKEKLGLKVIAIGGEKLARGLTLEGLCTSYFVRTTKMYDTLMQMGRWFGYRPGYVDVCRLYTTPDLVEWFEHIADASEELREEFDAMVVRGLTPLQYGLRVKSHPVMTVTSPLKMRASETLKLSYSGTLVQTVALLRKKEVLQKNLDATDRLIVAMGKGQYGPRQQRDSGEDSWGQSTLWRDVATADVLSFLDIFETHGNATSAKSRVLADFVRKMNVVGELKLWSVALLPAGIARGAPHVFSTGLSISSFPSRSGNLSKDGYSIGVLTDPTDEAIDVDHEHWKHALNMTLAEWKPDPARGRTIPPTRPSGKNVRAMREITGGALDRPVLMIYPLSPEQIPKREVVPEGSAPVTSMQVREPICTGWVSPVIAFAISFPSSESGVKVDYEVNYRYWEQEYGASE